MPINQGFYITESIIIMAKDKVMMPQSTAGLIRYFDDAKESIKFKPEHIAAISALVIVLEIVSKLLF